MASSPYKLTDDGLDIAVRLTPKGGRDLIDGLTIDADGRAWLAIRVSAPPESGKANKALIKLLAKRLGVAQGAVTLAAGETQRYKRLNIKGAPAALARAVDRLSRGDD